MSHLKNTLGVASVVALMTAIGAAWAQEAGEADAQQVNVTGVTVDTPKDSPRIYFFRDQGNSPETDPAAHVLEIHDQAAVAAAPAPQTVAQADQSPAPAPMAAPAPAPAPAPAATDDNSTSTTDNSAAAMPAPKADRN